MYKTWLPVTISSEGNCLHTIEGKKYCHDFIPNYKSTLYTCSRKTNYQNNTGISTKKRFIQKLSSIEFHPNELNNYDHVWQRYLHPF